MESDDFYDFDDFARRVANLNVEHPKIKAIWDKLDSDRKQNQFKENASKYGKKHISVIGPSGVGKSQMALRYEEKFNSYIEISEDGLEEVEIKPVLYVELPDPFTVKDFYLQIVYALGFPDIPKAINVADAQRLAFKQLKKRKVEVLFLDELDFILTSNLPNKAAMSAIKKMANKANIQLVLMGTPEAESLLDINFQNFRRYPRMYMLRFEQCDQNWCNLLKSIEERLKPPKAINLDDMETGFPQLLHHMSRGLLGILIPILQEYYSIQGLFDPGFNDKEKLEVRVEMFADLHLAYKNINGDITDDEMTKMLNRGY